MIFLIFSALPAFASLLQYNDLDVLTDTLWLVRTITRN